MGGSIQPLHGDKDLLSSCRCSFAPRLAFETETRVQKFPPLSGNLIGYIASRSTNKYTSHERKDPRNPKQNLFENQFGPFVTMSTMKEGKMPMTTATDGHGEKTTDEADKLSDEVSKLKLSDSSPSTVPAITPSTTTPTRTPIATSLPTTTASKPPVILCDFAYGLPKEARPRKEKLLAISKQMVTFLLWQVEAQQLNPNHQPHGLQIVGCPDEATETALTDRMHQLWKKASPETIFPRHLTFTDKPLEAFAFQDPTNPPVYLSPDADEVLDPAQPPPSTVVVGLLIDRRIQVNRSLEQATKLSLPAARLPLDAVPHVDRNEPLNVDCILEGMQQWYWNCQAAEAVSEDCFQRAALQALQHHETRHPERPRHSKSSTTAETIIFLDIDGVLLPFEGNRFRSTCGSLFPDHTLEAFSLILQEIEGAKIVLSSTWRVQDKFRKEIIAGLRSYGYAYGGPLLEAEFMDLTDPDMHGERQHEIHDWLQRNPDKIGAWIALDDEELMEGAENAARRAVFQGHVLKTESHIGLTVKNARYAIGLLQAQLSTP